MEKCKATISFRHGMSGRIYTFHCKWNAGHTGKHRAAGDIGLGIIKMPYIIVWAGSDAELRKKQPSIV